MGRPARRQARKVATRMTDATQGPDGPATYLVVLRHVLVAQDIAMTVAEFDPGAHIVTAAAAAEALPRLDGLGRLAVAFVGQGPSEFQGSALAERIAGLGGRVVLMGEEAELSGAEAGYRVLARPFTTGSILEHLKG